jgi:flagellar biosynthesis/type III secretory pathway protein FliH
MSSSINTLPYRSVVLTAAAVRALATSAWSPAELRAPGWPASEADAATAAALAAAEAEEQARREAAEQAAHAAAARERALADAHARGREAGLIEGANAERARLGDALNAAEAALDALRRGEARWAGTIEENICALAVGIAHHIVGREVGTAPDVVSAMVQRALAEFPIDQPLSVRVNPADLQVIATADTPVAGGGEDSTHRPAAAATARDLRWVADPRVAPGGCLVEGRDRIIDGRVDTGLERLYRRLTATDA